MSVVPYLLLLFTAAASGATLPQQQLEHFFDAVLEEGSHLVTVSTKTPGFSKNFGLFSISLSWDDISIRGPTILERKGSTAGMQTAEQAHVEAMVSLGLIHVEVKKLTLNFFGQTFSSDVHFSILDAEAPMTVDVFRNNLASCQVSVNMLRPMGNIVVHFGAQGAPAFVSALFDYGVSSLLRLFRIDSAFIMDRYFIPDLTSRINRELIIAARRVAC